MIYFMASIISYLFQNFSNKEFSKTVKRTSVGIMLIQNGICVLSSAAALFVAGGIKIMSAELMILAMVFGIFYLLTVFLLLRAFALGAMGASTILCNVGMFISAFYGIFRFNDKFTLYIALGAVLMFCVILLSSGEGDGKNGGAGWFFVALSSGIANGAVASVKREAVYLCPDGAQNFLLWGFLFAAIAAGVLLLIDRRKWTDAGCVIKQPKPVLCGIVAGLGTASANFFQMIALKTVSSAIVYPLTSGLLAVLLWLASFLFYKETKLRWQNVLSVVFCVAAVILINIK